MLYVSAQNSIIQGSIAANNTAIHSASITLDKTNFGTICDSAGNYLLENIPAGKYTLTVSHLNYKKYKQEIELLPNEIHTLHINLTALEDTTTLTDIVISGTMKPVTKQESPVPVEVYSSSFFKKNPTPNIFESLQNINGVRPQLNCNICNTGDIHMNGLEGPYTMILIDGMPIVSSLGTVYGLSGIPNSLIERVEIVKGPASSLYGSEAVGGLINIITKKPQNVPTLFADVLATSWGEINTDVGFKLKPGKKTTVLSSINYFNFSYKVDHNHDSFTDVTLQDRVSIFQKWNFERRENRLFSLAGRYMYEDRWGGDIKWNTSYRGGDSIYGESIYTNRAELIGNYQLPINEKVSLSFSLINHNQDSRYGTTSYIANQKIVFGQLTWDKTLNKHDLLTGTALRYTLYDDNTPATTYSNSKNKPDKTWLPGIFFQDEISWTPTHKLLLGFRYDHHNTHGSIYTPRIAYKWSVNKNNILRINAGTGFRVVNLFTEDHAALTGARDIAILNDLKPEKSYNTNINYINTIYLPSGSVIGVDATVFYTYFTNRIVPDYETDANKIIYNNLEGHAISKGISLNSDATFMNGLKLILGGTLMSNTITANGITAQQILTEKFSGTWSISYKIIPLQIVIDYTGNIYSPMRLPLLSEWDPRKQKSPWWSIQNIQITSSQFNKFEIYGGVKNLLNWTPNRGNPFIIARTHDPFDKKIVFDSKGQVIATEENPYALSFDPTYVYAPNQGIRIFLGIRYKLN